MDDESTSWSNAGDVFGAKVSNITRRSVYTASNKPINLTMPTVT